MRKFRGKKRKKHQQRKTLTQTQRQDQSTTCVPSLRLVILQLVVKLVCKCSCEMFAQDDIALSLSSNSMYKDEVEKTEALIDAIYITECIGIMALHSKDTLFRKIIQPRTHELF